MSDSELNGVPEDVYNARLIHREDLNGALSRFHVKLDDGSALDFEPGQYTTLGLIQRDENGAPVIGRRGPKLLRRAYSIASAPSATDAVTFYIVRVDDGALTPGLWQLQDGDRVFMDAKAKGTFTLKDVPRGVDMVFVGTGTGLAPFVSMIHQYRHDPPWRKLVLFDGVRLAEDLGYLQEMTELAANDPTITYVPCVTREPVGTSYDGPRGRVTEFLAPERFPEIAGFEMNAESCHVFLCGNPAMIEQVEDDLTDRGFTARDRKNPEGNLHFEKYW